MNHSELPTILVIIGVTGDLSRRKLLPAIEKVAAAKAIPEKFRVVGTTRQDLEAPQVLLQMSEDADHTFLKQNLSMFRMDPSIPDDYQRLKEHLEKLEAEMGAGCQRLFYLSVPPKVAQSIVQQLGESGLAHEKSVKLLMEKPFGTDLASARELDERIRQHFKEEQIYRIDHYVAKEMAQNLVVFREGNALFKRSWDSDFIDSIEIIAAESIGIEGRAAFFEQTGTLRDIIQSHLMQLAALTLMETPSAEHLEEVPARRLQALKQLHVPDLPVTEYAYRGQYDGYRHEVDNQSSTVETFVNLTLVSDDPRWKGVPIRLISGKALKDKVTKIRITYKKDEDFESNELFIRFQPDEGIELDVWTKVPGYDRQLARRSLRLDFAEDFPELPEAYEQILLDAINSTHTLFTTNDEVLETWRILDPLQKAWQQSDGSDLHFYEQGTTPVMKKAES